MPGQGAGLAVCMINLHRDVHLVSRELGLKMHGVPLALYHLLECPGLRSASLQTGLSWRDPRVHRVYSQGIQGVLPGHTGYAPRAQKTEHVGHTARGARQNERRSLALKCLERKPPCYGGNTKSPFRHDRRLYSV